MFLKLNVHNFSFENRIYLSPIIHKSRSRFPISVQASPFRMNWRPFKFTHSAFRETSSLSTNDKDAGSTVTVFMLRIYPLLTLPNGPNQRMDILVNS